MGVAAKFLMKFVEKKILIQKNVIQFKMTSNVLLERLNSFEKKSLDLGWN